MKEIRAGVVGTGYLGRFHAQKYAALPGVRLVGVTDADSARAQGVAAETGCRAFPDLPSLLAEVDAVSVVVPTTAHHGAAAACLEAGVHVLVEKPMTRTLAEADDLIRRAASRDLCLQVGHLERFNPAVLALSDILDRPRFIQSDRLATFRERGADVSVVLDLMIHDIDIILSLVPSPLKSVEAVGVPVITGETDIANARLAFGDGCVANVTASRVSREPTRKMRLFQADSYVSLDFNARRLTVLRKQEGATAIPGLPGIASSDRTFEQGDALAAEIAAFAAAVREKTRPLVAGEDGRRALEVAIQITALLNPESGRNG